MRLDEKVIGEIQWEKSLDNVIADTKTDFILAPYFGAIFQRSRKELIQKLKAGLKSGTYAPGLPITATVPKPGLLTRPGSILKPLDRLFYQGLIDHILPTIEESFDRERSFSHVPGSESGQLFEPSHDSWNRFQQAISDICAGSEFVLRADIASYFQSIPQHSLINSLDSDGCQSESIRALEEILAAFTERRSSGIIQGIYPSDVLGNYYLTAFDARLAMRGYKSARYVDDIFIGFDTELEGRRFMVEAEARLRSEGLEFNPIKTVLLPSSEMIREEKAVDGLFDEARNEVSTAIGFLTEGGYGFQGDWVSDEDIEGAEETEHDLIAVRALLNYKGETSSFDEKIDRFCLPLLRGARDPAGIDRCFEGLKLRPHLTRLYLSYLTFFTKSDDEVRKQVEALIRANGFFIDYQRMYHVAGVLGCRTVEQSTVGAVRRWMSNPAISVETRALCAIFCAKFGNGAVKAEVKDLYSTASETLRYAVLYSAKFYPRGERLAMRKAWGSHDDVCSLIANAK